MNKLTHGDRAAIIPRWPNSFDSQRGDQIPDDLVGAIIVAIGTTNERIEGGGLVLDYRPKNKQRVYRLILAFNELAMWIHQQAILAEDPESDS